ncbi:MAG: hypothetical protein R2771_08105 [Saprospiraceae bacterium]
MEKHLLKLADMYRFENDRVLEYAMELSQNIVSNDIVELNSNPLNSSLEFLKKTIER